jgi:hypothetical protein
MSQYVIPGTEPVYVIMVGYDPPLETFFVQVHTYDRPDTEDHLVYWRGTTPHELTTVAALAEAMAPYGVLSAEMHIQLQHDYDTRTTPTLLQRAIIARMQRGKKRRDAEDVEAS